MSSNGTALIPMTGSDKETRNRLLANVIMRGGSPEQVELVVAICDRYSLDPLLKHLVLINGAAYVTRDGLLHIAHASGNLDGIEVELHQAQDGEWSATCTIWRKNTQRPIRYTAYQKEHAQKGGAWTQYPRAMLTKCAEVMCLRRAFDVSLGAVEELGYDGESPQSSIGRVVTVEPAPRPAALPALPAGKAETWDDDALLTVCGGDYPPAQVRRAATVYLGRAANRDELFDRFKAAVRAGLSREIGDPVAKAAGEALKEREPGAYQRHPREDQRPILGDSPDARLAMLGRIRAAMATAGKSPEEVNAFVYASWKQPAIETLSEAEAEELIAILEARGDDDAGAAPTDTPQRYPDDTDDVPF